MCPATLSLIPRAGEYDLICHHCVSQVDTCHRSVSEYSDTNILGPSPVISYDDIRSEPISFALQAQNQTPSQLASVPLPYLKQPPYFTDLCSPFVGMCLVSCPRFRWPFGFGASAAASQQGDEEGEEQAPSPDIEPGPQSPENAEFNPEAPEFEPIHPGPPSPSAPSAPSAQPEQPEHHDQPAQPVTPAQPISRDQLRSPPDPGSLQGSSFDSEIHVHSPPMFWCDGIHDRGSSTRSLLSSLPREQRPRKSALADKARISQGGVKKVRFDWHRTEKASGVKRK
ncbi:hypothetical protein EYZ11_004020 [Aspergillus tanneri]|nr:hypothetical protein EYZ11_004020 [Aspergillus tanneri]